MMGIRGKGGGRKAAPPKSEIPALKVKLRGKDILYDGADTGFMSDLDRVRDPPLLGRALQALPSGSARRDGKRLWAVRQCGAAPLGKE